MPQKLFKELARLDQVEALVLGGSRAGQNFDQDSDYDVYVYLSAPLDLQMRQSILSNHCSYMEIGNAFWEEEDDCVLKSGVEIELIYRSLDDFDRDLQTVVLEHQAHNAYTTCMWYNLLHSQILYDRDGRYAACQDRYRLPYPAALKERIIQRQLLLLDQGLPAFSGQIKKALKRGDLPSINHRSSEFFASYFDLLFAFNEQLHPGEKRMLSYALENCSRLPQDMEADIQTYFHSLYQPDSQATALVALDSLVANITNLVKK